MPLVKSIHKQQLVAASNSKSQLCKKLPLVGAGEGEGGGEL